MLLTAFGRCVALAVLATELVGQADLGGVSCQPRAHDLGEVAVGSVTEFSFAVLWPDAAATHKEPELRLPDYLRQLRVDSFEREKGKLTTVVAVALQSERARDLAETIEVRLGARTVAFPVQAKVVVRPKGGSRMLVMESPFHWQSSTEPAAFAAWRKLVATATLDVDQRLCVAGRPNVDVALLQRVDVVWLAEGALHSLRPEEQALLQGFVCGGGRLVVVAGAFLEGTPAGASRLCKPFGLRIKDVEPPVGVVAVAAGAGLARHALTVGIESIQLDRVSPVESFGASPVTPLVQFEGDANQTFAALVTNVSGGELIVVGDSLWWNHLARCAGFERFTRNLMSRPPRLR